MAEKKTVLTIEDETALREAMVDVLNQAGYNAVGAENGQVGLEKAKELHPNLILLDLVMPIMDGFQTLEALKKEKITSPVLMLTNLNESEETHRAKKMGADGYIVKSDATLAEIAEQVKKHL